jgi:hypothetical protein
MCVPVSGCVLVCPCVPESMCPCLCVFMGLCLCPHECACVYMSVCYNIGNFWEILCSAHPTDSKKELCITSFATYGYTRLLLTVSTSYTFLLLTLSFHLYPRKYTFSTLKNQATYLTILLIEVQRPEQFPIFKALTYQSKRYWELSGPDET